MQKVTLIPGDGIGPEVVQAVKRIFEAARIAIEWEEINAGEAVYNETGELIPKALLESIERNKIALKGPITTPVGKGFRSVNVQLRQIFQLYANVRPCVTIPGIASRYSDVDLVIFRENTEGLYSGLEYYDPNFRIADTINRISHRGSYRLVEAAFEYAKANGKTQVTLAHKANIMKHAGSVFLEAGKEVAEKYPGIELDDKIIDNMCMQLVIRPEQFQIIATTNLFGDILSDLCAGLVGGLGIASGMNAGKDIAVFEAVHGSAPDIAGKGLANPTAVLKSAIMMLRYMGMRDKAEAIETALHATLADKNKQTGDLGGKSDTDAFTGYIIENLDRVSV